MTHSGGGGPVDRVVFVTAAPRETAAVVEGLGLHTIPPRRELVWLTPDFGVLETGIGKANAASAMARAVPSCEGAAIVNLGVGGTLDAARAGMGAVVAGAYSLFGDEGVGTPDGLIDCAAIGFPIMPGVPGDRLPASPALLRRVSTLADITAGIATVSTCSGTDALAAGVALRSGAIIEAMEGAAVGLVCHEAGLSFVEVRVVSNTTGDRAGQVWRLDAALSRMSAFVRSMCGARR